MVSRDRVLISWDRWLGGRIHWVWGPETNDCNDTGEELSATSSMALESKSFFTAWRSESLLLLCSSRGWWRSGGRRHWRLSVCFGRLSGRLPETVEKVLTIGTFSETAPPLRNESVLVLLTASCAPHFLQAVKGTRLLRSLVVSVLLGWTLSATSGVVVGLRKSYGLWIENAL